MLADLKEAVKNGESISTKDRYGATAVREMLYLLLSTMIIQLHIAAANGYIEVLEFILSQHGIDVNVQDNEGWTPFHAAVCWEQVTTIY